MKKPVPPGERPHWTTFRDAPAAKRPPPAHGIKIKTTGTTWWAKKWIEALERISSDYAQRLARGRSYARGGRAHDLTIEKGRARAKVTGSRPKPYDVRIEVAPLDDEAWTKVIAALAEKARFAAELMAGRMPEDVEDAFRSAGVTLFPARAGDLVTECSCPDWANPCKHVAAAHYVLGDALDRDPFLLFELRGRTKANVLEALRELRRRDEPEAQSDPKAPAQRPRKKKGSKGRKAIDPALFDAWRGPIPVPAASLARPDENVKPALLASLGKPPSWREKVSPAEALAARVHAASARALALALAEHEAPRDVDDAQ